MPTLTEIHEDPKLLAHYLNCEHLLEDEEEQALLREIETLEKHLVDVRKQLHELRQTETYCNRAMRRVREQFIELVRLDKPVVKRCSDMTYDNFVRECAREVFGIKGRTVEEVRQQCVERYPHLYKAVGDESEFTVQPVREMVGTTLPPIRVD